MSTAGAGVGSVTSEPAAVSCGLGGTVGGCVQRFGDGVLVELTAAAASGSSFVGWDGACTGTGRCRLVLSQDASVSATFAVVTPARRTLRVTTGVGTSGVGTVVSTAGVSAAGPLNCPIPSGSGGAACSAQLADGATVTLRAVPNSGHQFGGWGGACSGEGDCTVRFAADAVVTASFRGPPVATITLRAPRTTLAVGETLGLTAQGMTAGGVAIPDLSIAWSSSNSAVVQITPTGANGASVRGVAAGRAVVRVAGGGQYTDLEFAVTAAGGERVTLSVRPTGPGDGAVLGVRPGQADECFLGNGTAAAQCDGALAIGTRVTLRAQGIAGSTFARWDGGPCTGSDPVCTFTVNAPTTVRVYFATATGGSGTGTGNNTCVNGNPYEQRWNCVGHRGGVDLYWTAAGPSVGIYDAIVRVVNTTTTRKEVRFDPAFDCADGTRRTYAGVSTAVAARGSTTSGLVWYPCRTNVRPTFIYLNNVVVR